MKPKQVAELVRDALDIVHPDEPTDIVTGGILMHNNQVAAFKVDINGREFQITIRATE